VEFLQVKTVAPRKPDDGYEKTRAFYLAYGFRPLEEFQDLWDVDNPALQMIKVIRMLGRRIDAERRIGATGGRRPRGLERYFRTCSLVASKSRH
jgi:hypothetical protein